MWVLDGSLQSESGHCGMFWVDRDQRVWNWPSRWKHWLAGTYRIRRGCTHEHGAVVVACVGSRVLPDPGARHRRRVDARYRPVRWNCRIVFSRRTDPAAFYVWWNLHGGGGRRSHFMYCAAYQTGRAPTAREL
jgi:hypothetical protein